MTTTEYRFDSRISQSDLLTAKALLTGIERNIPVRAAMLGHAIHCYTLETELFSMDSYPVLAADKAAHKTFTKCTESLLNDIRFQQFLVTGEREQTRYWTETTTKVECKTRIDLLTKYAVIDLKTTSEVKQESFEAKLSGYDYDLQAAFYLDSVKLEQFLIIGVSKKNGKVFYVEFDRDSDFIKEGRKKYLFILNKIIQKNLFNRIYQARQQAKKREQQELQLLLEQVRQAAA